MSPDPLPVFGVAPIRLVGEERVQSIAFGNLKGRPQVMGSWKPLDREAAYLEPFAAALSSYLTMAVQEERLPRIWLPHHAVLEVVALLGNRYCAN